MARPLRIEYPGAYYHVMNQGNRREDIFLTDQDRKVFVDGLADSCEIYHIKLITYVLMANHFPPACADTASESKRVYAAFFSHLHSEV
jgi:putative transposase